MKNKKLNTALFILAASLVNILLIFVLFMVFTLLAQLIFPSPSEGAAAVILLAVFFLSFGLSFFIYFKLVKLLSRKIDMDAYFHPIFRPKRK